MLCVRTWNFPQRKCWTFLPWTKLCPYIAVRFGHRHFATETPFTRRAAIVARSSEFQQCSDTVCEPPETISFELALTLEPFMISERDKSLLEKQNRTP